MRAWLLTFVLLLSGCAEVDRHPAEEPVESFEWEVPAEPSVRPPVGHVEVRWPGGAWQTSLSWSNSLEVNATDVTELSLTNVPDRFEARFVGDLDPNATWDTNWWVWSASCCGAGGSAQGLEVSLPASIGRTVVAFDAWSQQGSHRAHAETTVSVLVDWTVRGVVQPLPVQAPGVPPVLQEIRVPVGGVGGTLKLTTEAVGDAPPTGRDLRLGYKMLYEEWCMNGPTPGSLDNTDHLLELPLWGEASTVQVYVGNPSGWCANGLGNGPVNAEPVEYLLRIQLAPSGFGGGYYH